MKKTAILAIGLLTLTAAIGGCKSDDDETLSKEQTDKAMATLQGDIVVSAKARVSGVDKTLLDGGAPCLFSFAKSGEETMIVSQEDFKVGNMPFSICFKIEVSLTPIPSLEKSDFSGDGWVRFSGKRGRIGLNGQMPDTAVDTTISKGDGSTLTGYVNTETREIQMQVGYAMSNVSVDIPRQAIDPARVGNYEAEKEKYNRDLDEYKKSHGLK